MFNKGEVQLKGLKDMKKNVIAVLLSVILAAGSIGTVPALAAETSGQDAMPGENLEESVEETSAASEEDVDENENDQKETSEEAGGADVEQTNMVLAAENPQKTEQETEDFSDENESVDEQDETDDAVMTEETTTVKDKADGAIMVEETTTVKDDADSTTDEVDTSSTIADTETEAVTEENVIVEERKEAKLAGDVVDSGSCGMNATWTLTGSDNDLTLTISGSGEMANYSESSMPWASNRTKIKSVIVEDGITSIGRYAFYMHNRLEDVSLSDSISKLGMYCFGECINLKNIELPDSLADLSYAFYGCTNLESIIIPSGVATIGACTFRECSKLSSVVIQEGVTSIDSTAFENCTSITSLIFPNSLKSIGYLSFRGCSSLTSIEIPNVTSIGDYAFQGCGSLTSILPGIRSTGYESFGECKSLEHVEIIDGTPKIEARAFCECKKLKSISIPDSVADIGYNAFSGCSSLESITIPNSITSLSDYVFSGCSSLESIIIPDGIGEIGACSFSNCTSLASVEIPNSVSNIKGGAFLGCSNLNNVILPDGITSIENSLFRGCEGLISIEIPSSVTSIGFYAFYGCTHLERVKLPLSINSIADNAFPSNAVLLVYENSYAHNYAIENDLPFELIKTASAQIVSASVSFTGTLGLNYYIDIPFEFIADEDAYIEYTIYKSEPETVRLKIADLETATIWGRKCRRVTVNTVVKSINDKITLHIYDGNGQKLSLLSAAGEDITENGFTYSVVGYCDAVMEQSSDEDMKDLAYKLKQYGFYVQEYLNYKADEVEPTLDVSGVTSDMLEDYKGYRTDALEGLEFAGITFLFKEDSALRFRFKTTEGFSIDDYNFTVDGTGVTPELIGDQYVIEVGNIRARDLSKEYEVVVTDQEGNSQTLSYSGLSYAKGLIEKGSTEKGRNAARALYLYYKAATTYFDN